MFFLHIFLVKQSGISARSKMTEVLAVYLSSWIYSAIYLIYSDILSLSAYLKEPKQNKFSWCLIGWKEDTSVEEEEEGKVIATRFIMSYL